MYTIGSRARPNFQSSYIQHRRTYANVRSCKRIITLHARSALFSFSLRARTRVVDQNTRTRLLKNTANRQFNLHRRPAKIHNDARGLSLAQLANQSHRNVMGALTPSYILPPHPLHTYVYVSNFRFNVPALPNCRIFFFLFKYT